MSDPALFPDAVSEETGTGSATGGAPRVRGPVRNQLLMLVSSDLESLLAPDHRARLVWDFVKAQNLSAFYERIRSVEGRPGRPAIDPAILMGLWLYATIEGVGCARVLARLCTSHDAYRWMCGGVAVNHHTLSDFKSEHPEDLDRILTESVAALLSAGGVTLERVAQDGVRVRAEAGAGSFRREPTLQERLEEALGQVQALRKELDDDPQATTRRQTAARERAARERVERVRRALEEREKVAAQRMKNKKKRTEEDKKQARASTTDPDARVMKMGDGGYRPAYNAQFATDVHSQVIVGVDVTNVGSDLGRMGEMRAQLRDKYGRFPTAMLVDGGYVMHEDIDSAESGGTTVYAPVRERKGKAGEKNRYERTPRDTDGVAKWRERMGTPTAAEIYKQRAATAECVNALARNRGLRRVWVRGLAKVKAGLLWYALAHNLMRAASLRRGCSATA